MLVPDGQGRDAASRAAELRRRALAHARGRVTEAVFPRNLVNCGGPVIATAMTRLAEIRRQVAR
jgi:iron complex transport system substrate-binding protein